LRQTRGARRRSRGERLRGWMKIVHAGGQPPNHLIHSAMGRLGTDPPELTARVTSRPAALSPIRTSPGRKRTVPPWTPEPASRETELSERAPPVVPRNSQAAPDASSPNVLWQTLRATLALCRITYPPTKHATSVQNQRHSGEVAEVLNGAPDPWPVQLQGARPYDDRARDYERHPLGYP
jgi:hypothetical protein